MDIFSSYFFFNFDSNAETVRPKGTINFAAVKIQNKSLAEKRKS